MREHTDQLYGAILSYEGKPGEYQLAYIEALKRELADATNEFAGLVDKDAEHFASGGGNRLGDPDAIATKIALPADFRVLH